MRPFTLVRLVVPASCSPPPLRRPSGP